MAKKVQENNKVLLTIVATAVIVGSAVYFFQQDKMAKAVEAMSQSAASAVTESPSGSVSPVVK